MADEEKTQQEEQAPEEKAEAPEAEADGASDEVAEDAEVPAGSGSDPDPTAADAEASEASESGAAGGDIPDDSEDEGPPHPKQLRKLGRSEFTGPAKPQRSSEERATERAEGRRRGAADRSRYRASTRRRGGDPRPGTPPADRDPGPKKVRTGTVVSTKAAKTITVRIEVTRRHPQYEKVVRRSDTLHAHDETGQAQEGDVVRVVETRPLSRTKRWRLVEVLERAR